MKRLIVCNDGTWNNPEQEDNGIPAPTNVFKIHNAIADKDGSTEQLRYYHPGVGGEGGNLKKVTGGALGIGISRHLRSAYHWLGCNYEPGDEIYLFGFSRGAFTSRSLGGLLGRGLLDLKALDSAEAWKRVEAAYDAYQDTSATGENRSWANDWAFADGTDPTPVKFIGVWDTVGALGIPDDLEFLNLLDRSDNWRFHDTELGDHIEIARHAMAIDEIRSSFSIARWSNAAQHGNAKEIWFPGAHSDVGGGYADTDLSDGALLWMIEESTGAGLAFRENVAGSIRPNATGILHNSYKGAFAKLRSRPRNVDAMIAENADKFHPSALERQADSPIAYPAYHPTTVLNAAGDTHTVEVFADTRWNATGLYMQAGHEYTFSAVGEWQDSRDTCDWHGTEDGKLSAGDIVRATGSFVGMFEERFRNFSDNQRTDFLGTKRVEELNWFVLVGAIANDSGTERPVKNDGTPVPHQQVDLTRHESRPLKIMHSGYLYCFPNDVWTLYGNNHGSITLTITRTA